MKGRSPSRPKGGRLTREDVRIWVEVARTVRAKPGAELPAHDDDEPVQLAEKTAPIVAVPAPAKPALPDKPKSLPLAPLERRLKQRLSRGQLDVTMKLDLHGMHQAQAHDALRGFLMRAYQNDVRVVLVVTGKGRTQISSETGFHDRMGILRRMVPHWLSEPDLRHIVLGFEEAARSHGGSGALYVRLRSGRRLTESAQI